MKTVDVITRAREEIRLIAGKNIETIVSCEREKNAWIISLEVVETKARLETNDIIAVYEIALDQSSLDVIRYKRVNRYTRCSLADSSAA
ncbi:MAG: gas vesicle protein GvpO [Pseudomonadota bacterium]